MEQIIVATDGSPVAGRAVDTAARLARDGGCELVILTVGGDIKSAELMRLASEAGDLSKTLELASVKILNQAKKRAQRIYPGDIVVRCEWGAPAEAIIDTVKREKADMLVVGKRGRSRLAGLLLGSVSQTLVNLTPCIVVVVP